MKSNRKHKLLVEDNKGMLAALPTVAFSVIMLFAISYVGVYMNGTISSQLVESYPSNLPANYTGSGEAATWRTSLENKTVNTLENLTDDFDSTLEIVVVAAIITVLTVPLMAIVAVKRLI